MSIENYDELEEIITHIIKIIGQYPDKFQPVLLEILLKDALESSRKTISMEPSISVVDTRTEDFILPIDVRAFLIQYSLNEGLLYKLFYIENNQISPIWRIKTIKKSIAQIQVALLISLENALKNGKFEFSYEEVRNRCKENLIYDANNFSTNFRSNKKYFKSFLDRDRITLSPEGKEKLSDAILELTWNE